MTVLWVGSGEHWPAQPAPTRPLFAMPLVEESVLDAAQIEGLRHLSIQAAIACTSRVAQRCALEATGMNPRWSAFAWSPGVVKAPASSASEGVRFLPTNGYVDRLGQLAPNLAQQGVVEVRVCGDHYEVDGFRIGGRLHYFNPLRQFWDAAGERIVRYSREHPEGITAAAAAAVRAVGLDDAPFCVELVRADRGWVVIEVNARLGEDPGIPELISDSDPLRIIEDAAAAYAEGVW